MVQHEIVVPQDTFGIFFFCLGRTDFTVDYAAYLQLVLVETLKVQRDVRVCE